MRKISRRSFLQAAAVVAGTTALAACGGSDSSSTAASTASSTAASSGDSTTNLVWTVWDQESTAYWKAMADGYMASHPNVTIEMLDLGSTD